MTSVCTDRLLLNLQHYSSLKPKQRDVIVEFVLGSDVFAILPTGYSKSLYYACLPRVYNCLLDATSFLVVVTPLT